MLGHECMLPDVPTQSSWYLTIGSNAGSQTKSFDKMLAVLEQYQILSYCSFEARGSNHRMVANWSYLNLICINLNAIRQAAGQLMIHPTVVGCYE